MLSSFSKKLRMTSYKWRLITASLGLGRFVKFPAGLRTGAGSGIRQALAGVLRSRPKWIFGIGWFATLCCFLPRWRCGSAGFQS